MLEVVFELVTSATNVSRHFNRNVSNSALIVSVRVFVPEPPEFVAESVIEKVPPTVGVPVMAPVEVLIYSPAGKGVAL
jgi:hypothetical protein